MLSTKEKASVEVLAYIIKNEGDIRDLSLANAFKKVLDKFEYSVSEIKELFMKIAENSNEQEDWPEEAVNGTTISEIDDESCPIFKFEYDNHYLNILIEKYKDILVNEWFGKEGKHFKKNHTSEIPEEKLMEAQFNKRFKRIPINSKKDIPDFTDPKYQTKMDYTYEWGGKNKFLVSNKYEFTIHKRCLVQPLVLFRVIIRLHNDKTKSKTIEPFVTGKTLNERLNKYFDLLNSKK